MNPLGLFLEPPGPMLTHLHTVCMACFECLPTRLNPLAERTCFSQVPNAAPPANLEAVKRDIFAFMGGSRDEPDSWYKEVPQGGGAPVPAYGEGGMVQMFQTQSLCVPHCASDQLAVLGFALRGP